MKTTMKTFLGFVVCVSLSFATGTAQFRVEGPEAPGHLFQGMDSVGDWIDISPQWLAGSSPTQASFRPGSPEMLFVGTCLDGLCYSLTQGNTWYREYTDFYVDQGIPSTWVRDVLFWEQNPMIGVAGTMSGTYWTDNGGLTWNAHSIFMDQPCMCSMILQVPNDDSIAVCLDITNNLYIYRWASMTWDPGIAITNSSQPSSMSFDAGDPPTLYIATQPTGIVFTKNLGQSFVIFSAGLPAMVPIVVCADPVIPGQVIVTEGPDLYRTTIGPKGNKAKVWFPYGTGLPGTNILSLIHDPVHPNRMYAGTMSNGVYVSYDRGAHWHPMTVQGMTHCSIVDVAVNPEDPDTLYASGHSGGPTSGGFYKTTIPFVKP
ncbi:MAG: hypothetical protein ABIK28_00845 [Planctomycetota bacterium]